MKNSPSQSDAIPTGALRPTTTWGEYNNLAFIVSQLLSRIQTATLVKIVACSNGGGLSPVGYVDVVPMVNQLDGAGNPVPHVTIYNVPYLRIQGGSNAIIIDPEVGDIGIALFASRDISKVKNTREPGNPGSDRQYSFSDAMYLGGALNAAPTQYIQFNTAGIRVHSPTLIKLDAPDIRLECERLVIDATESIVATSPAVTYNCETMVTNASTSVTINTPNFNVNGAYNLAGPMTQTGGANSTFSGDVTASGISVKTHKHTGVTAGPSLTGLPV